MSYAVLFPGQGSQYVGMGADLFDAMPDLLGDRSDDVLGWPLRQLCMDGPEEKLTRTEYAQPALFALSFALWTALSASTQIPPYAAAGHSLGEYTALTAAEAMTYDDALRVVARRGKAMSEAADASKSGMAALIGATVEEAEAIAVKRTSEGGSLEVANINAPGQVVVAGGAEDMEWLSDNARQLGVRRAIPLKVAGAFHSRFMQPAVGEVVEVLQSVDVAEPRFEVWSNTTAQPHVPDQIRATLADQVVSPVRFAESLEGMSAMGVGQFVHVGPGDVTAGMVKRTVPGAGVEVVSSLDAVAEVVAHLGTMG